MGDVLIHNSFSTKIEIFKIHVLPCKEQNALAHENRNYAHS